MFIGHSLADKENIRNIIEKRSAKVFFIGIGGVSMAALAELTLKRGVRVFGSDRQKNDRAEALKKQGANISYSHGKSEIYRIMPTLVVYSLAIDSNNPEYIAAKELNIPTVSRAEYMGSLISFYESSVGVMGSHGKSTVTAMLSKIFSEAGYAPTVIGGAEISNGSSFLEGGNGTLVYEACEYGDSFLNFSPGVSVMLNLDLDHTDYFKSKEQIKDSFASAANLAVRAVVLNDDDENLSDITSRINTRVITFSKNGNTEYRYSSKYEGKGKYSFELYCRGESLGMFSPGTIGEFNVTNSAAAAIAAIYMGVPSETVRSALSEFSGIPRRMELIGNFKSADVYYDYAHHPREIGATRDALKLMGYNNICTFFAPHTYTRTKTFFNEFAKELSLFSKSFIADIYGAREVPITGVTSSALAEAVRECGGRSEAILSDDIDALVSDENFDCIVIMGAGDLEKIKKQIIL